MLRCTLLFESPKKSMFKCSNKHTIIGLIRLLVKLDDFANYHDLKNLCRILFSLRFYVLVIEV